MPRIPRWLQRRWHGYSRRRSRNGGWGPTLSPYERKCPVRATFGLCNDDWTIHDALSGSLLWDHRVRLSLGRQLPKGIILGGGANNHLSGLMDAMSLPKPYYEDEKAGIVIYHGDCREIIPHLPKVDLVLTDPPYGVNLNVKTKSSQRGRPANKGFNGHELVRDWDNIVGDEGPFDPSFVLHFKKVILWGAFTTSLSCQSTQDGLYGTNDVARQATTMLTVNLPGRILGGRRGYLVSIGGGG